MVHGWVIAATGRAIVLGKATHMFESAILVGALSHLESHTQDFLLTIFPKFRNPSLRWFAGPLGAFLTLANTFATFGTFGWIRGKWQ